MNQPPIANAPRRECSGAFHDYVRAVFADHSAHSRLLRAARKRWLHRLGQRPTSGAEQLWEGEGGSTR